MKRFIRLAGLLGLALPLVLVTGAQSAPNSGPSASGHGSYTVADRNNGQPVQRQFSFSAGTRPDGTTNGSAVIQNPAADYRAEIDVTCLSVTGNTAKLGGVVRRSNDPEFNSQYKYAFFTVVDNGEPGTNDTISAVFFDQTAPPANCPFNDPFPQQRIDSGNIQVRPTGA